ncbi:hypothetical protein BEWA_031080 [Theileria equi strain WA]|uniref:Uncharacterized protein n=1 Tax=Theileria equi strain WA TaxID=1537102 RepID=L0AXG0_THEEQ|nr:hypothetical protein BEWA_031080 [Theileria equi strain WA]AFZ80255.1 hypothetical protein BEWA_031080 [Theileria equi strain WA]|eukprot:XP_004829921.1 hypothetical protein BEWA_031080 [Theileria equi strain WA]
MKNVSFASGGLTLSSILRKELEHHDDIMKLFWFAGMMSSLDTRCNPAKAFKFLLDNVAFANRIRRVDLSNSTFFVNSESYTLYQKGVFTKGISILVYMQYKLILMDASDVLKRATQVYLPSTTRKVLPKTRTKRHRVSPKAVLERADFSICDDLNKGCMYNRMITGIGIYSQYEFDHDNLILNHQRKIYKWTSSGYNNVDPIERGYSEKSKPTITDDERKIVIPKYLDDISDSKDDFEDLRLKYVNGKILGLYDNNTEFCPYSKRFYEASRKKRRVFSISESGNILSSLKREALSDSDDKTLPRMLMANFNRKYEKYINGPKNVVKKIFKRSQTGCYKSGNVCRNQRFNKEDKPSVMESNDLYEELKEFCSKEGDGPTFYFQSFVSTKSTRYKAATTLLNLLNLATLGKIGLASSSHGIAITVQE